MMTQVRKPVFDYFARPSARCRCTDRRHRGACLRVAGNRTLKAPDGRYVEHRLLCERCIEHNSFSE